MQHYHILKVNFYKPGQVKAKVKVTKKRKIHGTQPSQDASTRQIQDSYLNQYRRYAPNMIILEMRSRSQWPGNNMRHSTSQDASKNQIYDSYLKYYRRYAPDTIILEMRSEVKVRVTKKNGFPKMQHNYSRNEVRSRSNRWQWPKNCTWHYNIPICIHISNLGFLSQIM